MRKHPPPDWGYFGAAWGVVALGLGFVFMSTAQHAGTALVILGIFLLLFSLRPTLRSLWRTKRHGALLVEPSLDPLTHGWPVDPDEGLLAAGLLDLEFLVLRVTNDGEKNLQGLAARCSLEDGTVVPCFWSTKAGDDYAAGGSYVADLGVGQHRLLVIAQVFGVARQWAKLPTHGPIHKIPHNVTQLDGKDVNLFAARGPEILNLGLALDLTVRLRAAEGIDESVPVALGFRGEKPTFSLCP